MELQQIREQYVDIANQMDVLRKQQNELANHLIKIFDDEPDKEKKEQIIEMVFENKVQELHEYYFRKTYLEGKTYPNVEWNEN